jgi:formate dehydrogenase major subunit
MVGKENTGINPLRGQNNVQGACDMACLPNCFPGYQPLNAANVERFEKAWGAKQSEKVGLTASEMMEKGMKALYIAGENPIISDADVNHVKKTLEKLDFLVVQDIFLTETAEFADIVLPACSFAEKEGTFTNTERRIQFIHPIVKPAGEAKPDWQILLELMSKMGYENNPSCPEDIMKEIASLTPQYAGVTYEKIRRHEDGPLGVRWPIKPEDEHGTRFLHSTAFSRGKGLIRAIEYTPPAEATDAEYPTILTTGRVLYQYHTMTMTGKSPSIMDISPGGFLEISPTDAAKIGISEGGNVKVSSRRGEIFAKAKVTDRIKEGIVFIPFHFKDTYANILTNPAYDPVAKEPELKICAVKLEKAPDGAKTVQPRYEGK